MNETKAAIDRVRAGLCRVIRGPEFWDGHYAASDDPDDIGPYVPGPATGRVIVRGIGHGAKPDAIDAANAALDLIAATLSDQQAELEQARKDFAVERALVEKFDREAARYREALVRIRYHDADVDHDDPDVCLDVILEVAQTVLAEADR